MRPEDLLYGTTHEWVHLAPEASGTKMATIGISKFAIEALTDLVFIELPEVGSQVRAGESFGEIEPRFTHIHTQYQPKTQSLTGPGSKQRQN